MLRHQRMITLSLILSATYLSGCGQIPKRDPEFSPMRPPIIPVPAPANGAIYQADFSRELFTDAQARRVGDILTVNLVENLTASSKSETTVEKDNTTAITNPTILGQTPQFSLSSLLPLTATDGLTLANSLISANQFEGESDTSKSDSLSGNITVTVVEVYPNGNLYIRGEKRLTVNQGREYVRLSGIVRRGDIQANNTVESSKIADATIVYVGEGQAGDANRMGWLARFFNSPLFPF